LGSIDFAHAAGSERSEDFIWPEPSAGAQPHAHGFYANPRVLFAYRSWTDCLIPSNSGRFPIRWSGNASITSWLAPGATQTSPVGLPDRGAVGARRRTARLESERTDSSPRVRSARSKAYLKSNGGACRGGCRRSRPYSRRERKDKSGASFPDVRSRHRGPVGPQAMPILRAVRLKPDSTTEPSLVSHSQRPVRPTVGSREDVMVKWQGR
jgi:hypothetical protein